jgi:hypothetical protein
MKSRPPALDLTGTTPGSPPAYTSPSSTSIANSDSGKKRSITSTSEEKSPPLPTPPLAKREQDVPGNFEQEMEKALGKVGKTPDKEKKQPVLELSIPIGLH